MSKPNYSLLFVAGVLTICALLLFLPKTERLPAPSDGNSGSDAKPGGAELLAAVRKRTPRLPPAQALPPADFQQNEEALVNQPVEARMAFASELENKSSSDLFDMWLAEAKAKADLLKEHFIADALATRLRDNKPGSSDIVSQMKGFLLDASNDDYSRWHLAQVLGQAASVETLQALLGALSSTQEPEMRAWLLAQIVTASRSTWDGRYHEELSEAMEKSWEAADSKSDTLPYLGIALASVGAPKDLDVLFTDITRGGGSISEFEQHADDKAWLAFGSLEHVRNSAAIPYLASRLVEGSPDSITTSAAGYCLAAMGQSEATAVLLKWVGANNGDVRQYVASWFSQIRDEGSVQMVSRTVKQENFANQQNHDALQSALTLWLSHRSQNLRPVSE